MTWLVVLAVGAGSFLFRIAPLLLLERRALAPTGERIIRHAGLAAMTGLVAVSATHAAAGGNILPTLTAVAVALIVTLRGRPMLRTVASGGAAYAAVTLAMHLLSR